MKLQPLVSRRLLALASLLLIAFLAYTTNLQELASTISKARLELVAAALLASLFSLAFKTLRWRALLSEKRKVGLLHLFAVQASGIAVSNLSPGKLLEPLKVLPLKQHGFSSSFLVASVFWERALDLVILFFLAFWSLAFLDSSATTLFALLSAGLMLAIVVMFRHSQKVFRLLARLPALKFFGEGEAHHFKKRSLAAALALTGFAWLSDFTAFYLCFQALGIGLEFSRLASALAVAVLAGTISFLPGGFGSVEAVLSLLLATPSLYSNAQVLAGVFLGRAATVVFTTLLGFALLPLAKKK